MLMERYRDYFDSQRAGGAVIVIRYQDDLVEVPITEEREPSAGSDLSLGRWHTMLPTKPRSRWKTDHRRGGKKRR